MNDNAVNDSESNGAGSKKETLKANASFRDIRKKFENLSSDNVPVIDEPMKVPVAPARKPKISVQVDGKLEKKELCDSSLENVTPSKFRSSMIATPKKPISVKERTKLFESNSDIKGDSGNAIFVSAVAKSIPQKCHNPGDKLSLTPPVKPPRTFTSTEILRNENPVISKARNSEEFRRSSVVGIVSGSSIQSSMETFSNQKQRNSSLSFDSATARNDSATRAASVPVVPTRMENGNVPLKIQVPTSKIPGLRGYLKNLSNDLKDKVKHAKIFVDLTPTTVSPPKHYGTLKRSHSEEHIYAEPFMTRKSPPSATKEQTKNESLHYMCTPLIQPKTPDKKGDENVLNQKSMRNMIYDSFAPLRTIPKDAINARTSVIDASDSDVSMKAIEARIIYVKSIRQVSSSSICLSPKLYDALFIINVTNNQPEVTYTFPLKIPDEFKYSLLPHICFPHIQLYKPTSSYNSETFQFTLFDKGEKIFGYCLRILGWSAYNNSDMSSFWLKFPVAICILSRFNVPLFYNKLLNEIEKHLILSRPKCFKYIRSLQKLGIPNAGANVSIPDFTESSEGDRVVISRSLDSHTVGIELTRALQLLDVGILVKAVASLLLERRVLFFSSSTSNLYHCSKAISSLLYPFEWPHMFIPVLPSCLKVHCCSELPYILGFTSSNYESLLELLAEHDLLIIDIDKGIIVKSCNDEDTILPKRIQKAVITALNLAKNMTDPTEMMRDIMISEAFVHMFVEMIGHYENHFVEQNGDIIFQKDGLLKNAFSYSIQMFLQWFSETQMFDAFVTKSIWRSNYRKLCQNTLRTFFEKRVDEYKWELSHDGEKFSRLIEKTVRNIGEMIIHKLKK